VNEEFKKEYTEALSKFQNDPVYNKLTVIFINSVQTGLIDVDDIRTIAAIAMSILQETSAKVPKGATIN